MFNQMHFRTQKMLEHLMSSKSKLSLYGKQAIMKKGPSFDVFQILCETAALVSLHGWHVFGTHVLWDLCPWF